jgi:hypothetical protein
MKDLSTLQNAIAQSDTTFDEAGPDGALALLQQQPVADMLKKVPQYQFLWKATDEQLVELGR